MNGWGGFWLGFGIVISVGFCGWQDRVDCAWLNLTRACDYVNAHYMSPPHNPNR